MAEGTGQSPAGFREALGTIAGLLLFRDVVADDVGQAYRGLLTALASEEPTEATAHAVRLFRALADACEEGLLGPGDAWQRHLTQRIRFADNPFSRLAQRYPLAELPSGLLNAAERDLDGLVQLMRLAGSQLAQALTSLTGTSPWPDLEGLGPDRGDDALGAALLDEAAGRAGRRALVEKVGAHYRRHGSGRFALHRAFRWQLRPSGGALVPVRRPDPITFDDLIGYAEQRRIVRRNTENFLHRRPANNLLLYGERGTGKSSTVKALLNAYGADGLRLVDVAKSALADFPQIVEALADQPQRFIVFVDDLTFDEGETGYAELKAVLEGGVEVRPENVLIYATSNRRHLVIERFSDRLPPDDDIHLQDTQQEKLSLADRFGVTVIFLTPDQEEYLAIVAGLAKRRHLPIDDATLRRRALQWAAWNNGRSGRTARQFVDDLTAELGLGC